MTNHQLNRLLRLVNRTGDKFVILDKATDAAHVLLSLDNYEDLLGPDFEDDFDPRRLSPFDSGDDDDCSIPEDCEADDDDDENSDDTNSDSAGRLEWGEADFDATADDNGVFQEIKEVIKMPIVAPLEPAEPVAPAEPVGENLSDIPHEEEEEKFYLEPVE
ncbi:MAG: hypothetical protein EXS55_02865 [Candidatus Magasanikbacteria bacterium]|nr:hypothetical protein [Candidatus Magasanikbacteria bacterium]